MTDLAQPDDRIADGELLLRRIPASQNWVDPQIKSVDPLAFHPRQSDTTGLSLSRAKYAGPAEEAARGAEGKRFYIAILSVDRFCDAGIEAIPSPLPGHDGHAEIPALPFENRRSDRSREIVQCARQSSTSKGCLKAPPRTSNRGQQGHLFPFVLFVAFCSKPAVIAAARRARARRAVAGSRSKAR